MTKRKPLVLVLVIILMLIIASIITIITFLIPKPLNKIVSADNIFFIKIGITNGYFNNKTKEYESLAVYLESEQKEIFIKEIKNGKYTIRFSDYKARSKYIYEIYYTDGSKIKIDSYTVLKYGKDNKLTGSKKINLIASFEKFV